MTSDSRSSTRKLLRCQALITLPGGVSLKGRTVDIALGGVCLIVPNQLPSSQACRLTLDLALNGRAVHFNAEAKVVYSILSGTDGFRTGVQFRQMDDTNSKILVAILT